MQGEQRASTSRSVDYLSVFLAEHKGKNFLRSTVNDIPAFIITQALDQTFVECDHHMWIMAPRALPAGIEIDGGSDWVVLDRSFANYSVSSRDELVVGLEVVFQYTMSPVESFFHTLLRNSLFCATSVDHNLRLINWNPPRGCQCQNTHIVDWCCCSPNDFVVADLDRLLALDKEPVFFARKFESVVCHGIVEQVMDRVLNASTGERQGYHWHNEYDGGDRRPPDDATMALYQSWTRLAPKWLETTAQCSLGKMNLKRVEQVRHVDTLKAMATTFVLDATDADGKPAVQVMWTPRPFQRMTSSAASALLMTLDVGGTYDRKEEIFRDVAAAFGPNSAVKAAVHMQPISVVSVLTFVWLDPKGALAHLSEVSMSTTNAERTVDAELALLDPLLTGSWTLQIYLNKELIGKRIFGVLPIGTLTTSPPRYTATAPDWLALLLEPPHHNEAPSNAIEWTDKLVQSLWTVQAICAIGHLSDECTIDDCAGTEWSAISSDPHRWFDYADDTGS